MGLDLLELTLAAEETFGVEIRDDEAAVATTPGMVIDLIWSKLSSPDDGTCQSQRAFYLIRRAMMQTLQSDRNSIKPTTPLVSLLPSHNVRSAWHAIKTTLGACSWPDLTRPPWLKGMIYCITVLAIILTPMTMPSYPEISIRMIVVSSIVGALVVGIILLMITRPCRKRIPNNIHTVADLIPYATSSPDIPWTRELIGQRFKELTIEHLGLKESEYAEDKDFIGQLGAG